MKDEPLGHLGVGDRLTEGPAPELIDSAYALEVADGPLLYQAMSLADLAHTVMLLEAGIIPALDGSKLLASLLDLHTIPGDAFPFDPARGDAYTNREYALRQRAPQVAGWLPAGRPRREATTLGYLLVVRDQILGLTAGLLSLMKALLALAEDNLNTLMPDYTYLQTAHPTTLAHYLLTFVQPMTRDLDRLRAVFERVNLSPAGAGSTNGSRLPLNRNRLAELLGFDGVTIHTRDAMWQPDVPIELMSATVAFLVNLDRLVEDLQIWTTAEFGFIELADRHSRISVIMPQKKNPYGLAFVRGLAREMIGQLAAVAALGATPSGQVDNRIFIYGRVPRALQQSQRAARLLAETIHGLSVNPQVMARRVEEGFAGATDLVDTIMQTCMLDSQTAHRLVGQAVRVALDTHQPITTEILDAAAHRIIGQTLGLSDQVIVRALDPRNGINSRSGPGGANPDRVREMLGRFYDISARYETWRAECKARLETSEKMLIQTAEGLCRST